MLVWRRLFSQVVKRKYWALLFGTIAYILINALIIQLIEPETFTTPLHAAWYIMTTMTTVGYGDVSAQTAAGRLWVMLVVFTLGIGLFGLVIGVIADSFGQYRLLKEEGKLAFKEKNHYVVIGWTSKSKEAIKEILAANSQQAIVLIDELDKSPIDHEMVHYIHGSPTDFETFKKANLEAAASVMIFAPNGIEQADLADGKTLLIASSIENYDEGISENIYTIAEVLNDKHVRNFQHVKVDEFILSHTFVSHLMAKTAQSRGTSKIITKLISQQDGEGGNDLWEIQARSGWLTYGDAYEELKSKGAHLIADGSNLNVLDRLDKSLPMNEKLYVICDSKTYKTL
ncbi:potassium channel family protein [Bacillus sp. EB01]|uniref:potassium channel family protein n=1 Tax=Bacillus sp. EB01 TaxID=1347086 RepID=UPI0005C5FBB8|nr:potassium channel family protein [Bacillus sp. EB01]